MAQAPDNPELSACIGRLAGVLFAETRLADILRMAHASLLVSVAHVDAASASVVGPGEPLTPAETSASEEVLDLERRQYEIGRGPSVDALRKGHRYNAAIDPDQGTWHEFAAAAASRGFRSVLVLPLRAGRRTVGTLSAFSRTAAAFQVPEVAAAERLAEQAAVTLANALALASARQSVVRLEERAATTTAVAQAQGILMARYTCTTEQAFERLRRESQRTNRRLRTIADEIVAQQERMATSASGPG